MCLHFTQNSLPHYHITQTHLHPVQQLQERVYDSKSDVTNIFNLIKSIVSGFYEGRDLAKRLFIRDLKAQYRQSFLGLIWAFLLSIVTSLDWIFLNNQKIFQVNDTPVPYPVFVFTGTMFYQMFSEALRLPLSAVISSKSLLVKLNFPREALLLKSLYDIAFNSVIKLLVLAVIYMYFQVEVTIMIIYFPLALFSLILLLLI